MEEWRIVEFHRMEADMPGAGFIAEFENGKYLLNGWSVSASDIWRYGWRFAGRRSRMLHRMSD